MCAGIEPSKAAPHPFQMQVTLGAIDLQQVRNFQLTTRGWLDLLCKLWCTTVQKIEACHRITRWRNYGFLDNGAELTIGLKIYDAVTLWICDVIPKNCTSLRTRICCSEHLGKTMSKEDVVPEDQR